MRYGIYAYRHYGDCLFLNNGTVECILSLDFGPRILSFRLLTHENIFFEQPADADYLCSEDGWRVYGGTRLWLAPECVHDVYYPDTAPVSYELYDNGAHVTQARDARVGIGKSITVRFTDDPYAVTVEYAISNLGGGSLVGAPWAVSMMRGGAVLKADYIGVEQGDKPSGSLSLWNDTSLCDPRLTLTKTGLTVRQMPSDAYFKLGVLCRAGEASCNVAGQTFTKRFAFDADATYPDDNVNLEVYCCRWMMEFESLAPLRTIEPGETATHREQWSLCRAE